MAVEKLDFYLVLFRAKDIVHMGSDVYELEGGTYFFYRKLLNKIGFDTQQLKIICPKEEQVVHIYPDKDLGFAEKALKVELHELGKVKGKIDLLIALGQSDNLNFEELKPFAGKISKLFIDGQGLVRTKLGLSSFVIPDWLFEVEEVYIKVNKIEEKFMIKNSKRSNLHLIVTDADRGCAVHNGGLVNTFKPRTVINCKNIETRGCGDTFFAAFAASILNGRSIKESVLFGMSESELLIDEARLEASII